MKPAGSKSVARKLPQVHAAMAATLRGEPFKVFSDAEQRAMNRESLRVAADSLDDVTMDPGGEWFLTPDAEAVATDEERAALDAMLETHGLVNLLEALAQLCDSRVDELMLTNGRVVYHLAKEDDYCHAGECLRRLKHDARLKDL